MSSSPPLPYPGSYWVIPGSLLAGTYPGSKDPAEMKRRLVALLDAGIRSVIYLVDESEGEEPDAGDFGDSIEPVQAFVPYEDQLEELAEACDELVEIGRYTIDISSAAADQEMELILDAIDAEIEGSNHPTLVHCMNGNGYTGMVVGCYLARHGIATGKDGELHLNMEDGGFIAVRPNTRMSIATYRAEGDNEDKGIFSLLQGTFRSVPGWIGKYNPRSYQVRTPTATIGVRGTDHEPLVIPQGSAEGEPGSYDKVNVGGSYIQTRHGSIDVKPNQAGFAPWKGRPVPRHLPQVRRAPELRPVRRPPPADWPGCYWTDREPHHPRLHRPRAG